MQLSPQYSPELRFSVVQPLLRDFGWDFSYMIVRVAQNYADAALYQYEADLADFVLAVVDAYWNLVGARQNVEVQKESIGFFRPKPATQDDRYLSIRIFVEQEPSPQFASLAVEERASSMFSRYVGPLIRRMAAYVPPTGNPAPDGFTVIVEWLKQHAMGASDRPVHETMAVFVDRALALEYLAGSVPARELASRARVMAWDGAEALGPLKVSAWEDNFVATYKVRNYQMEKGVNCQ